VRVHGSAGMVVAAIALGCAVAEQPGGGDVPGRDDGGDRDDSDGPGDVDADVDSDVPDGADGEARDGADTADDVPVGPCTGAAVGGVCWYLGGEERSCDDACAGHGAYNEATRSFAGSSGSNANCDAVLDALGVGGARTSTLPASGAGVGCVFMAMTDVRYRVTDAPTVAEATYLVSSRACACGP